MRPRGVTCLDAAKIARIRQSMRRLAEEPADVRFEAELSRRLELEYQSRWGDGSASLHEPPVAFRPEPADVKSVQQSTVGVDGRASGFQNIQRALASTPSAQVNPQEAPVPASGERAWNWPLAVAVGIGAVFGIGGAGIAGAWDQFYAESEYVMVAPEPSRSTSAGLSAEPAFERLESESALSQGSRSSAVTRGDVNAHPSDTKTPARQAVTPGPSPASAERASVRLDAVPAAKKVRPASKSSRARSHVESSRVQSLTPARSTSASTSSLQRLVRKQVSQAAPATKTAQVLQRLQINLDLPSEESRLKASPSVDSRSERTLGAERNNRLRRESYTNRKRSDDSALGRQRDYDRRDAREGRVDRDSSRSRDRSSRRR